MITNEHIDFSQFPNMRKSKLECESCGEKYSEYKMKHWYVEDICETCNEDHSVNTCGFCGEGGEEDGYYCSKECSEADNTEGV